MSSESSKLGVECRNVSVRVVICCIFREEFCTHRTPIPAENKIDIQSQRNRACIYWY